LVSPNRSHRAIPSSPCLTATATTGRCRPRRLGDTTKHHPHHSVGEGEGEMGGDTFEWPRGKRQSLDSEGME
jgi:hypothetical protein